MRSPTRSIGFCGRTKLLHERAKEARFDTSRGSKRPGMHARSAPEALMIAEIFVLGALEGVTWVLLKGGRP